MQRKRTEKAGDVLRVRISIPPDGTGVQDYLKGVNAAGLNMEILQLMHLGYQFRMAMSRGGLPHFGRLPTPAAADTPAPQLSSIASSAPENIQPLEEVVSIANPLAESFKTMFGPAFERTRKQKAAA